MAAQTLASSVSSTGAQTAVKGLGIRRESDITSLVQVYGTASSFSLDIEGQLDGDCGWATLLTVTAFGMYAVTTPPNIRINVTAVSGGNVSAKVWRQE